MRKQLLIFALVICIVTSAVCIRPMQAKAEAITTVSLGSAAAAKILVALFAMAGIVFAAENYDDIWNGDGLDVEAVINNMTQFNRDLGMAMKTYITMGTAGAMTIIMNRHVWNLFQAYCRDRYGTDTSVKTTVSTINKEVEPVPAYANIQPSFVVTYQGQEYVGWENIHIDTDVLVFRYQQNENNVLPWYYSYVFVPTEKVATYDGFDFTVETAGQDMGYGRSDIYLSESLGYAKSRTYGRSYDYLFSSMTTNHTFYDLGNYTSETRNIMAQLVTEYRATGSLTIEENITASPVEGVAGGVATMLGQDVISFGNTATQDGTDVVIDGDLTIALPAEDVLEEKLKDLADGETTYEEYVAALGLAAVATTEETAEEITEKQEAIATYPITGVYTVSLNDLFPFCIPFDLYDLISALNAEPVAPEVTITLPVQYDGTEFTWQDYTLSLSAFETVAEVVRVFEYILFCIGLMLITRKLIEG